MSVSLLSLSTFFKYFIYHPESRHLTDWEFPVVEFARKFFSTWTLGLLPAMCKRIWGQSTIWDSKQKEEIFSRLRRSIEAIQPTNFKKEERNRTNDSCNQITHGLYLGNSEAFLDTTHFKFSYKNEYAETLTKETSNRLGFEKIITVCSRVNLYCDFEYLMNLKPDEISNSFSRWGIQWINVGKTATDSPEGWDPLIHDCTYPDSKEAAVEISLKGIPQNEMETLAETKRNKIQSIPASKWFSPVFNAMDEAVLNERKVLVHCQAGVSRSASIVAAYLICRHPGITSKQAIDFLRSKRSCVDPKFTTQLDQYREALLKEKPKN